MHARIARSTAGSAHEDRFDAPEELFWCKRLLDKGTVVASRPLADASIVGIAGHVKPRSEGSGTRRFADNSLPPICGITTSVRSRCDAVPILLELLHSISSASRLQYLVSRLLQETTGHGPNWLFILDQEDGP